MKSFEPYFKGQTAGGTGLRGFHYVEIFQHNRIKALISEKGHYSLVNLIDMHIFFYKDVCVGRAGETADYDANNTYED